MCFSKNDSIFQIYKSSQWYSYILAWIRFPTNLWPLYTQYFWRWTLQLSGNLCSKNWFWPDKDPNLIFHFHTDKGLWDCQNTCNRTDGCEFYTHSRVNYFEEQNKFKENVVSPVFHCFLWRTCDKFFIPQQGEWLDIRSGPRDCTVYNQNCPIVFDKNGALPSANLPAGYTQMTCPDTLPSCTCSTMAGNCTETCCTTGAPSNPRCKLTTPVGCKAVLDGTTDPLTCTETCDGSSEPQEPRYSWCFEVK